MPDHSPLCPHAAALHRPPAAALPPPSLVPRAQPTPVRRCDVAALDSANAAAAPSTPVQSEVDAAIKEIAWNVLVDGNRLRGESVPPALRLPCLHSRLVTAAAVAAMASRSLLTFPSSYHPNRCPGAGLVGFRTSANRVSHDDGTSLSAFPLPAFTRIAFHDAGSYSK